MGQNITLAAQFGNPTFTSLRTLEDATVGNNLTVSGSITAQSLIVNTTSYYSGSTRFGSIIGDTHQFTGSIFNSGSITSLQFNGSGAGLTGTAASLSIGGNAATATTAVNLSGLGTIQSTSTGTSYTVNYQVRENSGGVSNTNEIYAPQLAFHWGGVVASSIMMEASGRIAIRDNPGTSYQNFIANIIYANSSFQGNLTGNVTGNASTATNSSQLNGISSTQIFNNMGDNHSTRTSFDASTPSYGFGFRYVQGNTNGPATGGGSQFYSWYIGLGNDYPATGAGSYGMYVAIPRTATTPYMSVRYNENNGLGSWLKIAAGYADVLAGGSTITGTLNMATSGTNYIRMGVFPNSTTNTGEAWIGRASDRNSGTMTVQLGGNSASGRSFEVVDYAWSVVLFSVSSGGTATASGDIVAYSDARVKANIKPIDSSLEKVLKLTGVTYNRTDVEDKSSKIGFIAQEVEKVLPEVVTYDEKIDRYGVSYGNVTALLVEAIKEQQKQIDELKAKLA